MAPSVEVTVCATVVNTHAHIHGEREGEGREGGERAELKAITKNQKKISIKFVKEKSVRWVG